VSFPGDATETRLAVHLVSDSQIPARTLFISQDAAARLGLGEAARITWELRIDGFVDLTATQLTLELTMEQPIEETLLQLGQSKDLAGRLVHVPKGQSSVGFSLEIQGIPYRIRELAPSCTSEAIYEIARSRTQISVFFPGNRSGVDIAILADCSGSMGIEDLTEVSEIPPARGFSLFARSDRGERSVTRIHALRKALMDLLDWRQRIAGSTSRIALIAFGNISECRFPRPSGGLGMIEIDENTAEDTIRQFRDTIAVLRAENWSTDIGQALQFAASHISNYGKPENERLIVLISDGANWKPRGEEGSGEMIDALQEPVSLMEQLHETMNIHLHAIGISNGDIYDRYLRRTGRYAENQNTGHRPNHELLEHLVKVGGGDPTRIGDASVLEEYLQGLGTGVTRSLALMRVESTGPSLSTNERQKIAELIRERGSTSVSNPTDPRLISLRDRLRRQFEDCNRLCVVFSRQRLFDPTPEASTEVFEYGMCRHADSKWLYEVFIKNLYLVFDEGLPVELRRSAKATNLVPPLTDVAAVLHGPEFGQLAVLRHKLVSHDASPDDAYRVSQVTEKLIGVKSLARDDAEGWFRMQIATLEMLSNILEQLVQVFERAQAQSAPQQDPSAPIIRW
jgi:hypothetical protein